MSIRPIETKYAGCRFRSRLEARWAVFLNEAGIVWEYEPQGYLVNGRPYLPDFYLPDFDSFFEVKGTNDYDLGLLQEFSTQIYKQMIIAVGDIPEPTDWLDNWKGFTTIFPSDKFQQNIAVAYGYEDMFLRCDGCGLIKYMNSDYLSLKDGHCDGSRLIPLISEIKAAKSARFEHGEKG